MKRNNILCKILIIAFIILIIFPLIILLFWAFTKTWTWPKLFPESFSFRGFRYVLAKESNSLHILCYSILLSTLVTIVTIILSIPAAKALGVYRFRGKGLIKLIILAPVIIPPVSLGMGIHVAFIKFNLANSFLGVVIIHLLPCIPYAIRILSDVFEIIGDKYEQQGRVLGATTLNCFMNITIPLILPGIVSASFLVFIISFSQYFLTFLIGGGRVITLPLVMVPFIQSGDRSIAAAYSVVFIITTLVMMFSLEKLTKKYYKMNNVYYL